MKDTSKDDAVSAEAQRNAQIEALRKLTKELVEEGRSRRAKKQQHAGRTKAPEPSGR